MSETTQSNFSQSDLDEHLESLSDDELKIALTTAYDDMSEAGEKDFNSEWHVACFAAAAAYAIELEKRGLKMTSVH